MADTGSSSNSGFLNGISDSRIWNDAGNDIASLFSSNSDTTTATARLPTAAENATFQTRFDEASKIENTQDRFRAMAAAYTERDKSSASNIPNFSENLWVSSANDKLAAADVYKPANKVVISSAAKKSTSLLDDISEKLDLKKIADTAASTSDTGLLKDLKSAFATVQKSVKSAASTVSEIGSTAGKYISSAQSSLSKATRAYNAVQRVKYAATGPGDISSRISGVNRNLGTAFSTFGMPLDGDTTRLMYDINKTTVTYGTVQRMLTTNGSNSSSLNALTRGLEAFTGTSGIMYSVDSGARLFAGIGLVSASAKASLPGVARSVVSSLGTEYAHKVASGSLNNVAKSSNIDALRDLNLVVSAGTLKKINPNTLAIFSKAFMYTETYSVAQKKSLYKEVIETFNAVDPTWDNETVGDDETLDLTVVLGASSQFKDLISVGSLNTDFGDKLLGFGTIFRKTDVLTELQTSFPRTVVTANTVTRKYH